MQPVESVDVDRVIDDRSVRPVFQPVVDLDRDAVVGYEALARGDDGASPAALFRAAGDAGRIVELDWLCRERAVELAREAGLRHPLSLLINAEPETLLGADEDAARWGSFGDLRCYAEVTERRLLERPAELLRAVEQVRDQDWGIALDDVGAHPDSLSLLPVLRPDIIKLDLRLLDPPRAAGDSRVARVVHAALAQAADTGAVLVAEGIETERQLDLARAYGAHYGQGFLLGRPAPLPAELVSPSVAVPLLSRCVDRAVAPSPFAVIASSRPTRRLGPEALQEAARQLLAHALVLDPPPVVLLCVDDVGRLGADALELIDELRRTCLLRVLGCEPGSDRLTDQIAEDDAARADFDVIVVSSAFAGALVARPALPDDGRGTCDGVLVLDRALVATAAQALLQRVTATGSGRGDGFPDAQRALREHLPA